MTHEATRTKAAASGSTALIVVVSAPFAESRPRAVLSELMRRQGDAFRLKSAVSCLMMPRRPEDRFSCVFLKAARFLELENAGLLIGALDAGDGRRYGILLPSLLETLTEGRVPVLETTPEGAALLEARLNEEPFSPELRVIWVSLMDQAEPEGRNSPSGKAPSGRYGLSREEIESERAVSLLGSIIASELGIGPAHGEP